MLVLSRRAEQQIVFPNLGVRLRILEVRGRIVKVGIEAPSDIKILREEVLGLAADGDARPSQAAPELIELPLTIESEEEVEHRRRNELNVLQLRLDSIQRRIDGGESIDSAMVIDFLSGNPSPAAPNRPKAPLSTATHPNDPKPRSTAAPSVPIRLLVVEDSDNERGLMTYLLAAEGFVVHVARDGAEAYEQLHQWNTLPDVVLMDMHMPLYNGLDALRRIREDDRMQSLCVYAVTGSQRNVDDEPVGRGWDRWFSKPVNFAELVASIRTDVQQARSARPSLAALGSDATGELKCH